MRNIIKKKVGESGWVTYIKKRIRHNLNFLAIAEGPTGIGKSWMLIRVAYEIDKDFETRQVAFSFKQVMEIINSDWFKEKKWKIIIFDEAQTDISNRQWQSLTNKLMNFLLSTFRHQNIILLFSSPYSDFVDSQTMKLIHCKFEVRGHSKKRKITLVRPKLLQYNSKLKKFYEHSLYVIDKNRYNKLVFWDVNKPPQHLIEPYEKDKTEFTSRLNKDILQDLQEFADKKNGRHIVNIIEIGTFASKEANRLYVQHRDVHKVAEILKLSVPSTRARLGGKKGIDELKDYLQNFEKLKI